MKKLIAILSLFVLSLFVANSQSKVTYVDSLKKVTVSVSTDNVNKQLSNLSTNLDKQTATNQSLSESVAKLTVIADTYTKQVERRNKNDSLFVTDIFGYSTNEVKHVIKIQRWLNFLVLAVGIIYLAFVNSQLMIKSSSENLFIRGVLYLAIGTLSSLLLKWLLILIFNPGYFIIKEVMGLYT